MNKTAILGAALLCGIGYLAASCSGTKTNNAGSGGANNGGNTGGSSSQDSGTDAGSDVPAYCSQYKGGIEYDPDGGVIRYGASDPEDSLTLDVGGYYNMPPGPPYQYHGYCFTFSDSTDNTVGGTSTASPPCGTTGPCYTVASGLCSTMKLDQAYGSVSWGAGVGCSLHQGQASTATAGYTDIIGKTSVTVGVYGCKVPKVLQIQLNVTNPPFDDAGVLGDGYYCNRATLPEHPDANGIYTVTIPMTSFIEDCWNALTYPVIDPATHTVKSIQVQVSSDPSKATDWDFCISKLLIN